MYYILCFFIFILSYYSTIAQDSCNCYTYEVQLDGNLGALMGQAENVLTIHYDFYHLDKDSVIAVAYPVFFNSSLTNSIEDADTAIVMFNTLMYRSWEGEKSKYGGYKKYSVVQRDLNAYCKDEDNLKVEIDTTARGPSPPFLESAFRIISVNNEKLKFIWKGCGDNCVLPLKLIHNLSGNTHSAKEQFMEFF